MRPKKNIYFCSDYASFVCVFFFIVFVVNIIYFLFFYAAGFGFCAAATNFIRPSVDIDFGRSNGKPSALSQINDAKTPNPLDTPNKTV